MTELRADEIDHFQGGRRRLMRITMSGVAVHRSKDGPVDLPFASGDVLLANERDDVIVGPVSLAGVVDMAERILEGDQRTITDPLAILALATAVVGFGVAR